MAKLSKRNDSTQEFNFTVEKLENRDAPKPFVGGDLGDGELEKGGGKPSKTR